MAQNQWYCKAIGCRFKKLHTTLGHTCGLEGCANPTGHGQMEHFSQKVEPCFEFSSSLHGLHEVIPSSF